MPDYNPRLIKELETLVEKDPDSKYFCSLAQIYFATGRQEQAEKLCLNGLLKHPFYSQAYIILGEIYKEREEPEKALPLFEKAREMNPDNPNIYKNLAVIYKSQNSIEKTLQAYKKWSLLSPGNEMLSQTVQHLEKVLGLSEKSSNGNEMAEWEEGGSLSQGPLSDKNRLKLDKLHKILEKTEKFMKKASS